MMYIYTGFVEEECDFTPQFMNIRHYYTARRDDDRDSGSVMVGEWVVLSSPLPALLYLRKENFTAYNKDFKGYWW